MLLRSSAVTLCTSAQISFLAPGGGGLHTTCQAPCWALTVPPSGAWPIAGAAAPNSATSQSTARRHAPRRAGATQGARRAEITKLNTFAGWQIAGDQSNASRKVAAAKLAQQAVRAGVLCSRR